VLVNKRVLGIALVALLAPLLTLLSATSGAIEPAVAASGSGCHGYVYKFKKAKATNRVKMTYWVYCNRHVDLIHVRAFIREGDRWRYTKTVTCRDAYVCRAHASMKDKAGKQVYTARAVEGGDLADVTYVKNGAHHLWGCGGTWGDPMKCTGAGHTW
jgi:hypothetical protein